MPFRSALALSPAMPTPMPQAPIQNDDVLAGAVFDLEALQSSLPLFRRKVRRKQYLFRAGQPMTSLHLVHAGFFKTCIVSEDGREKITGFRMRGDLIGMDSLGMPHYACDARALDVGEVWDIPVAQLDALCAQAPTFRHCLTAALAREIRRDWLWMMSVSTLNAEQRVAAFLLDLAARQRALGFSARDLLLRMTRADLGNFLALQLETVTRALSHLDALGIITVQRREIRIDHPERLRCLTSGSAQFQ